LYRPPDDEQFKVKVKQSRYRPGVAQRGSRKLRFPDIMTTAQDGGKVCQPYAPAAFTLRKYTWYSFLLEAESTGRIMSLKNSNDTIRNRTRDLPVCSVEP
jgi:hypothetical protein